MLNHLLCVEGMRRRASSGFWGHHHPRQSITIHHIVTSLLYPKYCRLPHSVRPCLYNGRCATLRFICHATEKLVTTHRVLILYLASPFPTLCALYGLLADAGRCLREGWNRPSRRCLHQRLRLSLTMLSIATKSWQTKGQTVTITIYSRFRMRCIFRLNGLGSSASSVGRLFHGSSLLTRTSVSFKVKMKNCDGGVVSVLAGRSSVQKSEMLQDTIQTLTSLLPPSNNSPQNDRRCQRDSSCARLLGMDYPRAFPSPFVWPRRHYPRRR